MSKKKVDGLAAAATPAVPNDDYETQNHLRTLMDAEMIKSDPVKMDKVHKLAGRHHKAIKSISDLKELRNSKFGPKPHVMSDDLEKKGS